ncbi:dihydroxyacetone kinase subunit DhaK [Halomicroarcula sp. GCM10025817]|uniref:dihydroxyacetone kinase subunit DhaK n=1 Tax=Halomicroarcula sp. GCM10025817 TaxID=3252672 RepID=UPI003612729E
MKKLVNDPSNVVNEMLDGFVSAHSEDVERLEGTDVVVRNTAPVDGKVGVVTGGGSGHEPMHAGFVGEGMLDGAAAGNIFTSPPATDMREMIATVDGGEGVLAIIKNYEGDRMNFKTAASMTDVEFEQVIVDDDVAIADSSDRTGRRGVAGTVFVHKVAGAAAARGESLAEVARVAEKTIDNLATMGVALTSCITPEKGEPTVELGNDEMELGIGIHGEPGINRTTIESADEITDSLADAVISDLELGEEHEVVAMVNGLGGTPQSELYIVANRLDEILDAHSIGVHDMWVGEYCTSLDMAGCSITLLSIDEELRELLEYPVSTPGLTIK